jgi:hypothetical protein
MQIKGGASSYFVRKYIGKPLSQQMIKPHSQQNKNSKTINSFTNIGQKPSI